MRKSLVFIALLSFTVGAFAQTAVDLDAALKGAAKELTAKIPAKAKVAVANFSADSPKLADYLANELVKGLVAGGKQTVIERSAKNSAIIDAELTYQYSGEVNDDSMVSLGRKLGAEYLVIGDFEQFGGIYQLNVRAVAVETGEIPMLASSIIESSAKILDLLGEEAVLTSGDDYLRMIAQCQAKLNSIEKDKESEFQKLSIDTKGKYQKQLNAIYAKTQEDWESTTEYNDRVQKEANAVIQKRDVELDGIAKTVAIRYDDLTNTVKLRKAKLEKDLLTITFTLKDNAVQVLFGEFKREDEPKNWPVSITSTDKVLSFTWEGKYEVKAADVKTQYKAVEAAKAAKTLAGEITYAFIKGKNENTYDKKVIAALVTDTSTGATLLTVPVNAIVGSATASLQLAGNSVRATAKPAHPTAAAPSRASTTADAAPTPAVTQSTSVDPATTTTKPTANSAASSDPFFGPGNGWAFAGEGQFTFNVKKYKIEGEVFDTLSFQGKFTDKEWPWASIFTSAQQVINAIKAGDNVKFRVIGDGRPVRFTMKIDGSIEYISTFSTKKNEVVEIKIPYSKLYWNNWSGNKSGKFNKARITEIGFGFDESISQASLSRSVQIFDFRVY